MFPISVVIPNNSSFFCNRIFIGERSRPNLVQSEGWYQAEKTGSCYGCFISRQTL